ncbi:MAG: hypothetical protein HYT80_09725 [Euryarchaeota archaeon]|nr:hypothetical protein [Euryarchaeota archaeon]
MVQRSGRKLALLVLAPLAAFGAVSEASPGGDVRSDNMALVATLETGHGGDMAFWHDRAVLAHGAADEDFGNDGFVVIDIADPTRPAKIGEFVCTASAADIAVWGDLVILAAWKDPTDGPSCDAPASTFPGPEDFTGLRLVSITDPAHPVQVGAVATPGAVGPHTFTLLPDLDHKDDRGRPDPRLFAYLSSALADPLELIEIPLRDPSSARVAPGFVAPPGVACHDFSLFLPRSLASCDHGTTQLLDISDPLRPVVVSRIPNPLAHAHSAAFSWDGNTLVVADEPLPELFAEGVKGNDLPGSPCYAGTAVPRGGYWFYDVTDPRNPVLTDTFQLPREVKGGYCASHQMNVVPLRDGRDVLVAAWYLGGTTVIDFTDPRNVREIAHYQASPGDPQRRSNPWASYWYNGFAYANNLWANIFGPGVATTERGFDVFRIDDPLLEAAVRLPHFNFGTQECWTPHAAGRDLPDPCRDGPA